MGIFDGTYCMESSSNFVAAYVSMGLLDLIIIFKHQFNMVILGIPEEEAKKQDNWL